MNKVWLIIRRELLFRVRKKSFLITTILGPLLFGALIVAPALLSTIETDTRTILVHDRAMLLNFHEGSEEVRFVYIDPRRYSLEEAKAVVMNKGEYYALLYIPTGESWDPDFIATGIAMYSKNDISLKVRGFVENLIKWKIQEEKLKLLGVDPEVVKRSTTNVRVRTFYLEESSSKERQSDTEVKVVLAYVSSLVIYLFIFLYGSMVMRGVIEEKANRIVELIITSVKPFQLMMGKIIGIALTGLFQFLIWVVLSFGIYVLASQLIFREKFDAARVLAAQRAELEREGSAMPMDLDRSIEIIQAIENIHFPLVLSLFLFYFLFGYLVYGALFAIVGSTVDNESDTQQLVLPISVPLILSILFMPAVIDNPDGSLAVVLSYIPLTSPVIMMTRIPFGVPWWQIGLSMVFLIGFFVIAAWIAGRIYRVGILRYGKKYDLREVIKWLSYKI